MTSFRILHVCRGNMGTGRSTAGRRVIPPPPQAAAEECVR
jgi:hypothetical protein